MVGILHTWSLHPDFMLGAMRLEKRGTWDWMYEHDVPWDLGRNKVADHCLKSGAEWCLFMDSDIIPPVDGFMRLMSHNLPIVAGLYWRRHPDLFPEVFKKVNPEQFKPLDLNEIHMDLNRVDGVGAGFLLVHRRVFEALKNDVPKLKMGTLPGSMELYEFFKWSIFQPPWCSEDLYFCHKATEKGFPIYFDHEVACGHIISTMMVNGTGRFDWTPLEMLKS